MTPQLEEAQRLLRLAKRDKETFDLLCRMPEANLAAIGFHAQQAAEKTLKAILAVRQVEIRRTHDLAARSQAILDEGGKLPVSVEILRQLNPFAVEFRYNDEIIPAVSRTNLSACVETLVSWGSSVISEPPASTPSATDC